MICFKDITFCNAKCANETCPRKFTDAVYEQAIFWWGGDEPPIALSDFSEGCDDFVGVAE